jgi:hypothetical protein
VTLSQPTDRDCPRQGPTRWAAQDRARAHAAFSDPFGPPPSPRDYAHQAGVPRSTLGDWLRQDDPHGVEPEVVAFFRSPPGERFLRRVVLAAHLAFRQVGPCGLGTLRLFLEWSLLGRFVGPSHGAQHDLAASIEGLAVLFADTHRPALAEGMTPKAIALVPDEHFHAGPPCLVALEPVSNFILLEQYAPGRDACTWTAAIKGATAGLPVKVVLVCSDQAAALAACAGGLEAVHLPELFHGQRQLCGPLLGPLARQEQAARKELEGAELAQAYWAARQRRDQEGDRGPGRPPDFCWHLEASRLRARRAAEQARACAGRQEQAAGAIRGLGDDYHPFDARTGQPVTAEQMRRKLGGRLDVLEGVAQEAGLPQAAGQALERGREWLVALVGVLGWFWVVARGRLAGLGLPEQAERAVEQQLMPGLYWEQAARRGRTAEERRDKQELAERLLKEARAPGGALGQLEEGERQEVERVAGEVVGLFSRPSSCVEGRNGRLALFQHAQARLSQRRLGALTAVHNYLLRRPDGSTAAQRFFGQGHPDAFEWILARMPDLPRPAAKRPRKDNHAAPQPG